MVDAIHDNETIDALGGARLLSRGRPLGRSVVEAPRGQGLGFLPRLWQGYCRWRRRRASRIALYRLTDVQLRDIGLTRVEADREVHKSRMLML